MPEESVLAQMATDPPNVAKLVREFLSAQTLTVLPQNMFGDAVSQFIDKDDKHAMENFVEESMLDQQQNLMQQGGDEDDDEALLQAMEDFKLRMEHAFAAGKVKTTNVSH